MTSDIVMIVPIARNQISRLVWLSICAPRPAQHRPDAGAGSARPDRKAAPATGSGPGTEVTFMQQRPKRATQAVSSERGLQKAAQTCVLCARLVPTTSTPAPPKAVSEIGR